MSTKKRSQKLEPLTPRQREIFDYVKSRILAYDPPSIREIAQHFDIRSPNGVMATLSQLYRKGWLTQGEPSKARSIRLTGAALGVPPTPQPKGATK